MREVLLNLNKDAHFIDHNAQVFIVDVQSGGKGRTRDPGTVDEHYSVEQNAS